MASNRLEISVRSRPIGLYLGWRLAYHTTFLFEKPPSNENNYNYMTINYKLSKTKLHVNSKVFTME